MWRVGCLIELLTMPLPVALSTVCGWWLRWLWEHWLRLRPWWAWEQWRRLRPWWAWSPA